ncbi:Nif3-like dinuclear metal center hexameric protein [Aquabacterium sp. OR-4]|uniref:Nif3-like dinuclear metal center hexameric protein n=1 Tax=Aquabacterium sp. OR-4 TaxID=2978127 RepID=UPI0021B3D073|nr:Nif3-like dinuclear metal center hexameric protein [Aquabacterium sp. OR-4]MDT7834575.1 Nif3-like dinuclear metal center hexameric protein [Aquabacterium sp. OR-4]
MDSNHAQLGRGALETHLAGLLGVDRFKDYGPNGLQVEGRATVRRLVSGVTASLAFIEAAIADGADALLVHHGLFWRGQDGRVTGWMRQRLGRLLAADVSLYAYHLPLDAHAQLGNNAQLGARLGLVADAQFGEQALGFIGPAPEGTADAAALAARVAVALGRTPVLLPGDGRPLRRVAWCTGGAQGYFEAAIAAGADAFITGELSEPQAHIARETGAAFLACGHHATERYGVQAVGEHLAREFGIAHRFIEIDNPA